MKSISDLSKRSLYLSSNLIPSIFLLGISDKIILPAYSIISNESLVHVKHVQSIKSVNQFIKDLDFLLKNFQPINLESLIQKTTLKERIRNDLFHLSFDGN